MTSRGGCYVPGLHREPMLEDYAGQPHCWAWLQETMHFVGSNSWWHPGRSDRHGGDLCPDAVELGVVGDALEVVARRVGGGQRGGLLIG